MLNPNNTLYVNLFEQTQNKHALTISGMVFDFKNINVLLEPSYITYSSLNISNCSDLMTSPAASSLSVNKA